MRLSVGIIAHNEEANIGHLLSAILGEERDSAELTEVIVVSSASSDDTDRIVRDWESRDSRVRLIQEDERRGKNAAINVYLDAHAPGDVVMLFSADVLPEPKAIDRILEAFEDPQVGMVGGRPHPVNDSRTFLGFAAHALWEVHHRIASVSPKLGEVVAFRDVIESLPNELAVDEAAMESTIVDQGYRLAYRPEAIIHNRGPDTVSEFLEQRRRISAGHLHLKRLTGYEVSTQSLTRAFRIIPWSMVRGPREFLYLVGTCVLAWWGRCLGRFDLSLGKRTHRVWKIVPSTKNLGHHAPGVAAKGSRVEAGR